MSRVSRSFCIAFAVLVCCASVRAEQGYLTVLVMNTTNQPVPGVTLSVGGDDHKDTTGPDGKARILLAAETRENTPVRIYIAQQPLDPQKKVPLDMVFIQPWDGWVTVPPFANDNKNFFMIVIAERGSRALLEFPDTARALLNRLHSGGDEAPDTNTQMTPEERKQARLAAVAKDFGMTGEQAQRLIVKFIDAVKEKEAKGQADEQDVGLAKFYAGNFEEARVAFSEAKAQRKKEAEQALAKVAESAYFEGRAYFQQTKYQEAIASYQEAMGYRPNDTNILGDLAYAYETVGRFDDAEPLLKKALEINEKTYGETHDEVANSVMSLGAFYLNRRENAKGAAQFERMVSIREKAKGPDDLHLAHDLGNLAVAYMGIGKFAEAEKSLNRALAIVEKVKGPDAPDLAFTLNTIASLHEVMDETLQAENTLKRSLGVLRKAMDAEPDKEKAKRKWASNYADAAARLGRIYLDQERYARALPLLREALDYEESRGPLTPHDLDKLSVLADLYERVGDFKSAEQLCVRALAIRENALGKEHIKVTAEIIELSVAYELQKKFAEAEQLRMRVLSIAEKNSAQTQSNALFSLARYHERRKNFSKAEDYYKQALAKAEGATPASPDDVISRIDSLAAYYERQKKFTEAETLRKRIVSIVEKEAKDNPSAQVAVLNMMAQFYEIQKRYAEAEDYYKRSEAALAQVTNAKDSEMASLIGDRADMYETQERFDEAEQLYKRAVEITSKAGVAEYPNKVATLNDLGNFYRRRKKYDEAEQQYKQAQAIVDNAKDVKAEHRLTLLFNMGTLLEDKKKYAEAEAIYKQFLTIVEKAYGPEHPEVGLLLQKIAETYRQQGKNTEAEENYKRALSIFERELGPEDVQVADGLEAYAAFLHGLKRDPEAVAMEGRAKKIRDSLKRLQEDN